MRLNLLCYLLLSCLTGPVLDARANTDTLVRYLDNRKKPISADKAMYRRKLVFADKRWVVYDYLLFNESLQSVRHFADDSLNIEDGMFLRYYHERSPELSVLYRDNLREGLMTQWYPEGAKMLETQYQQGKLTGPYTRWHENGKLMAEGRYQDSLMVGEWQWHYSNGALASKEAYERGTLKSIHCYDSNGKEVSRPDSLEEPPSFPGGEAALYKFLQKHVRYPEKATNAGASGTVMVMFWVEKDGQLTDIQVVGRVHPALDAEALRVISSMPRFRCARSHLVPVRVRFRIPIRFVLQ